MRSAPTNNEVKKNDFWICLLPINEWVKFAAWFTDCQGFVGNKLSLSVYHLSVNIAQQYSTPPTLVSSDVRTLDTVIHYPGSDLFSRGNIGAVTEYFYMANYSSQPIVNTTLSDLSLSHHCAHRLPLCQCQLEKAKKAGVEASTTTTLPDSSPAHSHSALTQPDQTRWCNKSISNTTMYFQYTFKVNL